MNSIETPSGKTATGENFPVGSRLIRADLRPHVHAFYGFARTADDIADNPALSAEEKLRRLDLMAAVLTGEAMEGSPAAAAMRADLAATGLAPKNCLDLLVAFKMDAAKQRYADWGELMDYCRYSAAPVGRQVLDLHGAPAAAYAPSDALCAALQVINHLQDCAEDYRDLDRVYLPQADLTAMGAATADLGAAHTSPTLRRTFDLMLGRTEALLVEGRGLPPAAGSLRLTCETMAILTLAERLTAMLRQRDPLAQRVKPSRAGFLATTLRGVWRGLWLAAPAPVAIAGKTR